MNTPPKVFTWLRRCPDSTYLLAAGANTYSRGSKQTHAKCKPNPIHVNCNCNRIFSCFAALGHLARAGGALTVDIVQFQVKEALEWLDQEDKGSERRRLAAVLVLKELARNTPTLFNAYVDGFLENIWTALRDPNEVNNEL